MQGQPDPHYFGKGSVTQIPSRIHFYADDNNPHQMALLASSMPDDVSENTPWWRLTSSQSLVNSINRFFSVAYETKEAILPQGYGSVPRILGQGIATAKTRKEKSEQSTIQDMDVRENLRITHGAYHVHALDMWSTSHLLWAPFTQVISRMSKEDLKIKD